MDVEMDAREKGWRHGCRDGYMEKVWMHGKGWRHGERDRYMGKGIEAWM